MIELESVTKSYRRGACEVRALDGVSLVVERGELAVVEGPSGSGKTTLLFVISGLVRPTSGRVTVAGVELTAKSAGELAELRRTTFGFVFQTFHLIPYLTALENVTVPMGLAGASPKDAAARARDLLAQFGLAERADHHPSELSAGEKQRVAIARAVANRPPVVLADEPTGNLDAKSADDVLAALDEVHKGGATVLVVTHDPRIASRAGRVLRLEKGKLI
jgi:putative ABC transport system ATP-binding protein